MIVELAAEAEQDLERIADWIARDNPAAALDLIRQLHRSCLELARFPKRFALVPRYEHQGIRHRVHGNYLIFYRVEAGRVTVIHILHGAMDYAGLLFAE